MVSQLYLMWASLLNTLEAWMKRHRVPSAAQDANMKKLKHRRNNNWHPALPLAFLLDPLYAQTATGMPGPPGQRLFGPKKLSSVGI